MCGDGGGDDGGGGFLWFPQTLSRLEDTTAELQLLRLRERVFWRVPTGRPSLSFSTLRRFSLTKP